MERPNVVIVMARCSRGGQGFGIRFEEKGRGDWIADWAFGVQGAAAMREGYDQGDITGAFGFDVAYPGCPHCHALSIFQCVCGKIACWNGDHRTVTCPWCGATIELRDHIENLSVEGDR